MWFNRIFIKCKLFWNFLLKSNCCPNNSINWFNSRNKDQIKFKWCHWDHCSYSYHVQLHGVSASYNVYLISIGWHLTCSIRSLYKQQVFSAIMITIMREGLSKSNCHGSVKWDINFFVCFGLGVKSANLPGRLNYQIDFDDVINEFDVYNISRMIEVSRQCWHFGDS